MVKHLFQKGNKINIGRIPWNKGKSWSEDIKRKIGLANSGRKMSEEAKEKVKIKLRISMLGNKNAVGSKSWLGKCGEIHPRWIKDRSKLSKIQERNDSAYKEWVKECKKRDKNICKFKGQKCSGYNIVHHILPWRDYPELRYNLKNGITLCQFHHPKKREDEKRLIPFFQEMIMSKELI